MKYEPKIGDKLYTYSPSTGYWCSMVRDPWTVVEVKGNTCTVQACKLLFRGPRYYNSLPYAICEDPEGKLLKLRWSEKKQRWQESPATSYPRVAVFGGWDYQPYLN